MDVFQPPALYPPLLTKPLNLVNESRYETLIEIKKQLRTGLNDRASCFIDDQASKDKLDFQATIQRYSDKYSKKSKLVEGNKWQPDWTRLPRELKFFQQGEVSKEKKQPTKRKVPASGKKEKSGKVKKEAMDYIDLDTLAKIITADDEPENEEGGEGAGANEEGAATKSRDKDKTKGSDDEGEKDQEDDELEGDDEEENIEEENDYIDTYFDNGEDYNDDDGGGDDDGPVY